MNPALVRQNVDDPTQNMRIPTQNLPGLGSLVPEIDTPNTPQKTGQSLGALPSLAAGSPMPKGPDFNSLRPIVTNPRQDLENTLMQKIQSYENPAKPKGFWQNLGHVLAQNPFSMAYRNTANVQHLDQLAGLQNQDLAEKQQASRGQLESAQAAAAPIAAGAKQLNAGARVAEHGLKIDDNGQLVPDEESPVYQHQQLANQLLDSTRNLRDAQTDFQQMRGDPNSPLNQQIAERLRVAQQQQDRLTQLIGARQEQADASMMRTRAQVLGVGPDNQPLAGAMLTDDQRPVGSNFQSNVRPTGQQRNKSNMAESADQQINDMKQIVSTRPDIFGPAAGRTTDFTVWLGSQDPDAQRFRAARTIAGDHLAGTFGGRSEAALQALDSAIGHFRDNPAAVAAGLNQLQEANHLFLQAGKVHTVGARGEATGNKTQKFTIGSTVYNIPADRVAEFKKDHPDAR